MQDTFGGATETSISAIEWTMANLIKQPNLMQKVQSEIDNVVGKDNKVAENDIPKLHYLQAVVKENFRLHPPAPFLIPRESHTACKIAGYEIPTNTRMFVNVWGMGRDPRIWEDPLKFIPERFTKGSPLANLEVNGQHYQLMPFGTGRRQCPALSMGLATVTMLIANLVQAFDWSHLGGPNNLDMSESKSSWVTLMATPLQAIPKPRFPDEFY
jgi:cytochrome P450